ncbi:MAG: hypothetical protein L0Y62_03800 [Nitrospirae bacterium]|nr:hypothetical protein [Nitrospirota bacterium]
MSAALKTAFVVLSVILIIILARPLLSEYKASRDPEQYPQRLENNLRLASAITYEDARYHYLTGAFYLSKADKENIDLSINSLINALKRNPADSRTWMMLSKAYMRLGMTEMAEFAIKKAVLMNKNNPINIWEAAVVYLSMDKYSEALDLFKRYIRMMPNEQWKVYSLMFGVGIKSSAILEDLVPHDYKFYNSYIQFLKYKQLHKEIAAAWSKMGTLNLATRDYVDYCSYLIDNGEMDTASAVWNDFIKRFKIERASDDSNILWNPDFELDIQNGGFDWRIGQTAGVKIQIDRGVRRTGRASLSANFDGRHNPDALIAYEIVRAEPNRKYFLTGYIKTSNLTTKNGVYLFASGHKCGAFEKRSGMLTGTHEWEKMEIEFVAPKDCLSIKVGIKRDQSAKFDNKIGGEVWIDSLTLTKN